MKLKSDCSVSTRVSRRSRQVVRSAVRLVAPRISPAVKRISRASGRSKSPDTAVLPNNLTRTSRLASRKMSTASRSSKSIEPVRSIVPKSGIVASHSTDQPATRNPYDGDTAFNLYLREIGEVELLTPAEEIRLARKIKRGDAKAREHMIRANLRLVVKIARDYEGYGLPLLDLINEGNIGLMKGVERFDPRKGAKLSTYAAWWIKQAIKRALANQSKTIRLPVHVVDKLFHLRRTAVRLEETLGREPTDEELADELGYAVARVRQWRKAAVRPVSLEAPLGEDRDTSVAEIIKDERANTPYEQLEEKTVGSMVHQMVGTLDQREQTILRLRFGLGGDDKKTLEEVGQQFGVTRERIRQIEEQALKKLRRKIERLEAARIAA